MSEDLQKPPVIDLEALMQPISEENPAGENLRYAAIYGEIAEARRADKVLPQGQWQTELKIADYRKVIDLAVPVLIGQTKDLQISVWLSEALVSEFGFAGLRDSLKLVGGLQENFWENLFPEIEDGDMEGRANAIESFDKQISMGIKRAAITSGEGYSFLDYEDSKRFDIPENIDTLDSTDQERYREIQAQAVAENRVTADLWRKAKAATRRAFCEELNTSVEECWTEYNELNRIIEEKFDSNQMPGLSNLKKALDDIETQVKKLLEEKRAEEPDPADDVEEANTDENGDAAAVGTAVGASNGAIRNRADALKRLGEVAEFFRKNEPHSPISYLVQRAVKWGEMPLESWLQDVIKDETVLFQLRQTLGFNTGTTDADDSNGSNE